MEQSTDAASVKIFPPAIPLVTILLGISLQWIFPIDWLEPPASGMNEWLGGFIVLFSILGLGLWSVVLVRRSGQSENPWKPTTTIIEHGPFKVSRNPMYLQMVLVCIGFAVILWNVWILLLSVLCALLLQHLVIFHEETYLENKFGEQYRDYKRRVRRWL